MGMYTEIFVEGRIKSGPDADVLNHLFGDGASVRAVHPFFDKTRWDFIGRCGSYYFPNHTSFSRMTYDDISKEYHFVSHSSLKNYSGEIEAFFDWLSTTSADYFGYRRYEESRFIDEQYTSENEEECI